jgi:hypothetical protein
MRNISTTGLDPAFASLLVGYDFGELQQHRGTIYGMWPDLTLAYLNPAWTMFARDNGGEPNISTAWPLGRSIIDAIPPPLRPFYVENYHRCLAEGRPWEHVYECSSPRVERKLHMSVLPLGRAQGFLVINSTHLERPHQRAAAAPIEGLYENPSGFIVQCSHCRRVRRADVSHQWDWVAEWVSRQPNNISHGLCEPCIGYYYKDQ